MLEPPQLRGEDARRWLEQRGQINVIGAKPHAVLAQRCARALLQPFDLLCNFLTFQHAQPFNELVCDATRNAGHVIRRGKPEQRLQNSLDVRLQPKIETGLDSIARRTAQVLVGYDSQPRL